MGGGDIVKRLAVLVTALMMLASGWAAPASRSEQSVRFTTFDPCTNERVRIESHVLVVVHSSGTQLLFHEVDRFQGTGLTTGTKYVGHREVTDTFTASNGALQFTDEVSTLLILYSMLSSTSRVTTRA